MRLYNKQNNTLLLGDIKLLFESVTRNNQILRNLRTLKPFCCILLVIIRAEKHYFQKKKEFTSRGIFFNCDVILSYEGREHAKYLKILHSWLPYNILVFWFKDTEARGGGGGGDSHIKGMGMLVGNFELNVWVNILLIARIFYRPCGALKHTLTRKIPARSIC